MGGHKPKAIGGEHEVFLARRVREGGFTLRGLVAELAERGLKVDYRSVSLRWWDRLSRGASSSWRCEGYF
jgi:transposase